ncbi:MAG: 3-hydroxyacyl-CoA dehydrogenase [Pirellulaceae bacterium]|nr:MAG: 3-hydroxyacyl-CoA dehydrogenase [Pirellulaceae bacterium]
MSQTVPSTNNPIRELNRCVAIEQHEDGVVVWFSSPDRSVNVIDAGMLSGWEMAVDWIVDAPRPPHWVVFRSRRDSCFFVGADVHRIAEFRDEHKVQQVIERGQRLTMRIAELPVPTVAFIAGTCLGGGLELALACRYRVAVSHRKTQLGLPEIKLGLIPGWGGTQRLPQLIGPRRAVTMILRGRSVGVEEALRYGLIDRIVDSSDIEPDTYRQVIDQLRSCWRRRRTAGRLLAATAPARKLWHYLARRQLGYRLEQYPALSAALDAVMASLRTGGRAFDVERRRFVQLVFTDPAQNLLRVFIDRERARKVATWLPSVADEPPREPERLAVVGAGTMGAGIAAMSALAGLDVWVKEIDLTALQAGRQRVERLMHRQLADGRITHAEFEAALQRLHYTTSWEELHRCQMAIEAVIEQLEIKKDVFGQLDRVLPVDALLATNTSSLSVTAMAQATRRVSHVLGIHFFNPVERMELVEVARPAAADQWAVAMALQLVRRLGKTPIVTGDAPGFVVNRILFPYLGEALRMAQEGISITLIDKQMRRFGMPMGPLELLDQVGIDVAASVAASLVGIQPDAAELAPLFERMLAKRWRGKKSGRGFYVYVGGKRRRPNSLLVTTGAETREDLPGTIPDGMNAVQRRLVYPMLNEAVRCMDEQLVASPWMIDLAMVLGTGFAPRHGGPLRLIHVLGRNVVLKNLEALRACHGERFAPADGLQHPQGSPLSASVEEPNHEHRHPTHS